MKLVALILAAFAVSASADFAKEALQVHNELRDTHNAPPLRLSSALSRGAQSYARKLAQMGYLKHSDKKTRPGIGENLIYRCSSGPGEVLPAEKAVTDWYDEICMYNFKQPGYYSRTGHFTALVWKDTKELGIGTATSKKGRMNCLWVVARYRSGGNFNSREYFERNVLKGTFRSSYCNNKSVMDEPEKMDE
ncbi:predicted protein [Nematostella vectensis]|uniref:SCP domain-containing protein n=1 Tax=Nematostella vectensis TaxID=45351 RepID=A7SZU6_NEMVE|nr:predicted protein [Nematostella vectensis]|eukprot:XP_001622870.1 predicted protein [Nematostella vectensis]